MFEVSFSSEGMYPEFYSVLAQTVLLLWSWDMSATPWHDKIQLRLDGKSAVRYWTSSIQTLILELFCFSQKVLTHCPEQKAKGVS